MPELEVMPAPEIVTRTRPLRVPKREDEYAAFLRLLPSLLSAYRGQYVAVHEGEVVESGDDQVAVAVRAYRPHG